MVHWCCFVFLSLNLSITLMQGCIIMWRNDMISFCLRMKQCHIWPIMSQGELFHEWSDFFLGKSTISSLSSYYEGVGLRAPSERKPSCQEEIEPWKRVPGKMTSRMWAADKRLHGGVKLVNWSTFFVNWSTSSTVEDVSFHLCVRCRVWEQVVKHPQSTGINNDKHKHENRVFVRCW